MYSRPVSSHRSKIFNCEISLHFHINLYLFSFLFKLYNNNIICAALMNFFEVLLLIKMNVVPKSMRVRVSDLWRRSVVGGLFNITMINGKGHPNTSQQNSDLISLGLMSSRTSMPMNSFVRVSPPVVLFWMPNGQTKPNHILNPNAMFVMYAGVLAMSVSSSFGKYSNFPIEKNREKLENLKTCRKNVCRSYRQ